MIFIKKHKNIIGIICALLIYLSFINMKFVSTPYSIFGILIIFVFYLAFTNLNFDFNKKQNLLVLGLSFLFSFLYILGGIVILYMRENNVDIFEVFFKIDNFFLIICYFLTFSILINHLLNLIINYKTSNILLSKTISKKIFLSYFFIIFIAWIPYFLNYFPGSLTPDSILQINQVLGISQLSDHHPIFHTLLVSSIFTPVYKLTNNMNTSISVFVVFQMLLMSSIFSTLIIFLKNRNVNKKILTFILFYYSLSPIFAYYSITVWKDIIFGGIFLLLSLFIMNLIEKKEKLVAKDFILFSLLSLLFIFFRNNAIYIFIIILPFFLISFRKHRRHFTISFLFVIVFFFFIKSIVFPAFDISKSSSSEYIGMPLQQIGRMVFKNTTFDEKERVLINELMPIEKMKEAYNPYVSDGIKFNPAFNIEVFNSNKFEYLKLYFKLILKHPRIAVESYLISTVGYWYPDFKNWAAAKDVYVSENPEIKIRRESLINNELDKHFDFIESRETPIIGMQWSIGFCFWLIFLSFVLLLATNNKKYLLLYSLIFGLWLTMMVASPVQGEFRYVFSAFTTLPLYLILPILKNNESKKNEKNSKKS